MSDKEKVAQWMIQKGYATGHGDTVEDLLKELEWQILENWHRAMVNGVETEREACAKLCDEALLQLNETANQIEESEYMEKCVIQGAMTQSVKLGKAIRARSEK